jgi:hypothetical protein
MRLKVIVVVAALIAGCATRYINPTTTQNPPPAERLSSFVRFELQRVSLQPPYAGQNANERATARIQEHFDSKVSLIIDDWNRAAVLGQPGRTLVIEPRIEHIKFISGGVRFWVGPYAGSSAVIMKVKYTDKSSGKVVSEPEFFQRAAAWSGALTMEGKIMQCSRGLSRS